MKEKSRSSESEGLTSKRRQFLQTVAAGSFVSAGIGNAAAADSEKSIDHLLVAFDQLDRESQRLFRHALKQGELETQSLPQALRDYPFVEYRSSVYSHSARHVRDRPTEVAVPEKVASVPDGRTVVDLADLSADARQAFERIHSKGRVETKGGLPEDLSFVNYVQADGNVYEMNFLHHEGDLSYVLTPSVIENFGGGEA